METLAENRPLSDLSRDELLEIASDLSYSMNQLSENWDDAAAAWLSVKNEDKGWKLWGSIVESDGEEGFSRDVTRQIGEWCSKQAAGNPILKRGFTLRYGNVFGKGLTIDGDLSTQFKNRIGRNRLKKVLFCSDAYEENERHLFEYGNLIIAYNRMTDTAIRIPLDQITNTAQMPEDPTDVVFYQRTYAQQEIGSTNVKTVTEWYPVLEFYEDHRQMIPEKIGEHPVNQNWVIIDLKVNVPSNGVWGIADAFAAAPYAWAYSQYIRNASSLLEALNQIAWKVVAKNKATATAAGLKLQERRGKVASMTEGVDLQAVPKAGQVDMHDGLALAAMAASALEVPVVALTSDSGAAAGSYGAVASLDGPTVAAARSRQEKWVGFYDRVFRAMGVKDRRINFPKITEDPIHRQVSSLSVARTTGAIWADEYRAAILEAMDIAPMHSESPEPNEYARAQNALGYIQAMMQQVTDEITGGDPVARQGNSGVNGVLGDIDNTNRDLDRTPGTGDNG